MTFASHVATALEYARRKHPPIHSLHEGYAIIKEELDEFWDEVKRQEPSPTAVVSELLHIAAMCQRVAEDVVVRIPAPVTRKTRENPMLLSHDLAL